MEELDLPFVKNHLVKNEKEAKEIFDKIGSKNIIARISSEDIPHKTDVWGVVFNVKSSEDSLNAYKTILKNVEKNVPKANIEWIIYSVYIGANNDLREIFISNMMIS